MKTAEVRERYLSFFVEREHRIVPSSTLVPQNDPTLLFTNAGMNQFKDALLGREDLGFSRATSSQRCVRAGGKHNDLENVGYTARHLTFFEMLGNFSFGDYFKEETISWAWEFVTDVLGLPEDRLWVTVHPTDAESRDLWENKIGVARARVVDHEENFWAMGETGPCGPCTELFYDHGPDVAGGPPGSADEDGDRYIEFWNLVFPQFDRAPDGELHPLPQPGVDTGMGLERITTVLQGVHSNFEIDLFRSLMASAGRFAGLNDEREMLANPSLRVIADHLRSSAFLIADGVIPGNDDRDNVLRRIIRRGLRHGYKLEIREPFFHALVDDLVVEMGDAFPLLKDKQTDITTTLLREEERFSETLNQGMELLDKTIANLKGDRIPGDVIFQLYDTYGFPTDLTADVARERGLDVDIDGFEVAMEKQRDRGRASTRFSFTLGQRIHTDSKVDFVGYDCVTDTTKVVGLFDMDGRPIAAIGAGDSGVVVLDRTPFYAESGGQVGDNGVLSNATVRFVVDDTQSSGDQHLHVGVLNQGQLELGAELTASVDAPRRQQIRLNHSATHLLHAALRAVLGTHVQQRGSLVDSERLRFDFSHAQPVAPDELVQVERLVNEQIQLNSEVVVDRLSYDDAIAKGAMALFGEKYGDEVRVLSMGGDYSVELCGGTHVVRTGDIGLCRITSETGIAAGVRRIEAVTGAGALARVEETQQLLGEIGARLKSAPHDLVDRVAQLLAENRRLGKQVAHLTQRLASGEGSDLASSAQEIEGIQVVAAEVQGDAKGMMQTLDMLRSKLGSAVIVLGQVVGGKVSLVAGVSRDLTDKISAPELVNEIGGMVGAKGGGRPDMARAGGGSRPQDLSQALERVASWVAERA